MYQKENALYITVLISSIVLLSFIVAFTFTILWYHRKRTQLQKELENRNLCKLENERRRVAGSLQKILSPLFDSIILEMEELKLRDSENSNTLMGIKKLASGAAEQLRNISSILVPQQLDEFGLMTALENFAGTIREAYQLPIYIEGHAIPRLPQEVEIHIYRMVEEVLDNIVIHAQATQAFLNISASDKRITLVVSDDGIGLDLLAVRKNRKALGLRNILARAFILDAEVFVESNEEGGTTYIIEIPIS